MASPIIMPQLGETVAEGKILAWFKSVGDEIKEGDNLFEVETDKVTVEVQSIVSGILSEIRVGAGAVAKIGAVVAVVGADSPAEQAKVAPKAASAPSRSPFEEVTTPAENFGPARGPEGVHLTPVARRLVAQNDLDIAKLVAEAARSGGKRIGGHEVRAAMASGLAAPRAAASQAPAPVTARAPSPAGQAVPLNAVRQKTAERLAENWRAIPHVFQAIEVDFTAVDRVRAKRRAAFQAANGFSLTYLPFIARATCLALQAFPKVNARFDGAALTIASAVNLGIAVDLDHNGLVVPVVREAADLTLIGLAKAMRRLIDKARAGKLSADDLSGGTYSISNNGAFGVTFTAPIINAPQVAILSSDAIRLKPAVVATPEGHFIAPRMIGMIGQSFDHRAFDGAYSAAFLSNLKSIIEEKNWDDEFSAAT